MLRPFVPASAVDHPQHGCYRVAVLDDEHIHQDVTVSRTTHRPSNPSADQIRGAEDRRPCWPAAARSGSAVNMSQAHRIRHRPAASAARREPLLRQRPGRQHPMARGGRQQAMASALLHADAVCSRRPRHPDGRQLNSSTPAPARWRLAARRLGLRQACRRTVRGRVRQPGEPGDPTATANAGAPEIAPGPLRAKAHCATLRGRQQLRFSFTTPG